ncbi:MAG: hypothetical protein QXQ53_01315 [Candidatus Methanosuratincola sp.]
MNGIAVVKDGNDKKVHFMNYKVRKGGKKNEKEKEDSARRGRDEPLDGDETMRLAMLVLAELDLKFGNIDGFGYEMRLREIEKV